MGLPIAIGMAIASPNKQVYCLISDGEMAEGSIWESLYFLSKANLFNLHIYANFNDYTGYGYTGFLAYDLAKMSTDIDELEVTKNPPLLEGLKGHYQVMDEEMYKELKEYYE